jgi:hypothetical protein
MNRYQGGGQQKRNICFYSNSKKDQWSKAFLEELAKTPWASEFNFICVDPSPNRPSLPAWLKQVPTIVIDGDKEPVKTDTEVMNWLYERKMREMPAKVSERGQVAAVAAAAEPVSWIDNEMGGLGNAGYSFIDSDTSTGGNGGAAIPGAFTYLNGSATPGDRESQASLNQAIQNQGTRSKKEQMFDKQLDLYKQQRDMGVPQGPARQ